MRIFNPYFFRKSRLKQLIDIDMGLCYLGYKVKKFTKYQAGIVAFIPVLIIGAVLVLALTATSFRKNVNPSGQQVLSESNETSGDEKPEIKSEEIENETPEPKDAEVEDETENETEFEVKEGSEAAKVKIKVSSSAGEFRFREAEFEAKTSFPLSVNKLTNELTVTTPAGTRVVAILPDQAVANMLASGNLSETNEIHLTFDNGNLVYEINGVKFEKLLGLFSVSIDKTGQVSASDGQIVGVNQSFFSKFLDSLSI